MNLISPSKLTTMAAGLKAIGSRKAEHACLCAMCGTALKEGDLIDDFAPGDAFTDHPALAAKTSPVICGDCKAVWRKEFLQKYSKSVICATGIYPFAKMENQAHFLMNPPMPPFIIMLSDQQQQHLVWRTPVNYSREMLQIRYGGTILTIRRNILIEALDAAKALVARLNEGRKKQDQIKSPFIRLDWNIEDLRHGSLRHDVLALQDDVSRKEIELLRSITSGEMWALCVLMAGKAPVCPDPVVTPSTGLPKTNQPTE